MKPALYRAFLWTISGFAIGVSTWVILGGTVWPVVFDDWSVSRALSNLPFSIIYGGFFAAFLGAVLAPFYFVLFAFYEDLSEKYNWIKNETRGLLLTVAVFALPPAVVIAYSFEEPIVENEFFWIEFSEMFLLTIITFVSAILIPRLTLKKLKPKRNAT